MYQWLCNWVISMHSIKIIRKEVQYFHKTFTIKYKYTCITQQIGKLVN